MSYRESNQEVAEGLVRLSGSVSQPFVGRCVYELSDRVREAEFDVIGAYSDGSLKKHFCSAEVGVIEQVL